MYSSRLQNTPKNHLKPRPASIETPQNTSTTPVLDLVAHKKHQTFPSQATSPRHVLYKLARLIVLQEAACVSSCAKSTWPTSPSTRTASSRAWISWSTWVGGNARREPSCRIIHSANLASCSSTALIAAGRHPSPASRSSNRSCLTKRPNSVMQVH